MGTVDLVVTDLDGTLWHTDDTLHPLTASALVELGRRGVPLLVATGRRVGSTRDPLARFGLAPPAVVLNGAVALHLSTGERFHRQVFAPEVAVRVLDCFADHGLSPCVYVDHREVEVFISDAPSTNPGHLDQLGGCARVADLTAIVADQPVLAFSIIGRPRQLLEPVQGSLAGIAETHLARSIDLGDAAFTVAPLNVSKWSGVVAYCELSGLDSSRVLAAGDGPNDIELLTNVSVSVVPLDGHADAVAIADHVVPEARLGGWASILDLV